MPELPEVENVRRSLEPVLVGQPILKAQQFRDNLRYPFPANLPHQLQSRKILKIHRRAKYLLMDLNDHSSLVIHLGMSGKIRILPVEHALELLPHDHFVFTLPTANIVYHDPRRFGLIDLISTRDLRTHTYFAHLGPEPWDITASQFYEALQQTKRPCKVAILDQELLVGVGNIYACESLYRAGISPDRPANALSFAESERLLKVIQQVLTEAIEKGGSTLRDFYHPSGEAGYFQNTFQVYDRENAPCPQCKAPIQRTQHTGRSTYFCGRCQV